MKIRNVAMLLNNLLYQIDILASEVFMMMHPKKYVNDFNVFDGSWCFKFFLKGCCVLNRNIISS